MSYIVIDDNLRTMTIPTDIVLLGVESDDDVNKIAFQMPKEYCGIDLSTFQARINYMNANGEGDVYIAEDLEVDGDDPSLMTFTWIVGRTACAYKGYTQFIVCLKKFDNNSNVLQEFNTTVYKLPVLQGLETSEAVVQQNPDIIEYILNKLNKSGSGMDPNQYYTKNEVNDLIPKKLPNPNALTINGEVYDGSEAVNMTIEATSEVEAHASGKFIHITDAVPKAVNNLVLYDDQQAELESGNLVVTNKNLFRIDLLAAQVVSKGITFTKNVDGSVTISGTSSGTYPMTSCNLDKNIFVIGESYTVSTSKTSGYTYIQLMMTYSDNSVDYIVSRNSPRTFKITKEVVSCVASIQLTDSGIFVDDEVVYPQLEFGETATKFILNEYTSMTYDGTTMPVLPDIICNLWSNDDEVADISVFYEADSVQSRISERLAAIAVKPEPYHEVTGTLLAGNTAVVLQDPLIMDDSTIEVYTDTYGLSPTSVTAVTGAVTLLFIAQANDVKVKVRIS